MYDIIGDIHGYAAPLVRLLEKMGYDNSNGYYKHPARQAIFLGDFIDRGPDQRAVVNIARSMVENGSAKAIMGNHELNAIAFQTEHPSGSGNFLKPRSNRNIRTHIAFLNEYIHSKNELQEALNWFKTLPMWLELDGLRIIHACWDEQHISFLKDNYSEVGNLTDELLIKGFTESTKEFWALETLLKGKEIELPNNEYFFDKMGNKRSNIRTKWWDHTCRTYRDAYMGPEEDRNTVTDVPLQAQHTEPYDESAPPVFVGHYWLNDVHPAPLAKNIACCDYSVAIDKGKLAAYRWDGEQELSETKFVYVDR